MLKDVKIHVPSAVIKGHDATLNCTYDLEGDDLYAVKWYKNDREFFRYTPEDEKPIKQFKIKGLEVSETESTANQLVLKNVTNEIAGDFKCEVTADQPSFFTIFKTSQLEVVELPREDPLISGLLNRYRLGEVLRANCSSEMSYPAANLTWYVNGYPVDASRVHKHKRHGPEGYYQSADSILRLPITKQLFAKGRLKIRCVASMHDVYYRSSEKSVELERKRRHHQHQNNVVGPQDVGTAAPPYGVQWKQAAQAASGHRPFDQGNAVDSTLIFESRPGEEFNVATKANLDFLNLYLLNFFLFLYLIR